MDAAGAAARLAGAHSAPRVDVRQADNDHPLMQIAILDLGPYLSGHKAGALESTAREMAAACESLGFFFVKNHGVSSELIERVFEQTARFHSLPLEKKLEVRMQT